MSAILKDCVFVFEFLAAFVGIITFLRIRSSILLYLSLILLFVFVSDYYGFLNQKSSEFSKFKYYNNVLFPPLVLYIGTYYYLLANPKAKIWALIGSLLYIGIYVVNIKFLQPIHAEFLTYSYCFGSLLLCINILVYLKESLEKDKLPILKESPFLWISFGLFTYYGVNLPFIGFYNYLAKVSQEFLTIYFNLTFVLSCIMNLLICIGFLCFKIR